MPKITAEQVEIRKKEIIDACEKIYRAEGFYSVTIKGISEATSFTRPAIYTYFETKDEILLALLSREYEQWIDDLNAVLVSAPRLDRAQVAAILADTLAEREVLLRIENMNLYEIELNSRTEWLAEFKAQFKTATDTLCEIIRAYEPEVSERELAVFIRTFMAFIFGVYPFTHHTDKQNKAMELAGVDMEEPSIHDMFYDCLMMVLPGRSK